MNDLERFNACMEYAPGVPRPNHEVGTWKKTAADWAAAAPAVAGKFTWAWFRGEDALGMDRREFIPIDYGFIPPFKEEVIDETPEYIVRRSKKGIITRALKEGTVDNQRACMDEYIGFPIATPVDWPEVKRRLAAADSRRYPKDLDARIARWQRRDYPLCLGQNCKANGFYWRAREFMGTENLSLAWYDYPEMLHEIMAWYADFIIEISRPVLAKIKPDYFTFNEDMSMKNGPLLSPDTYREFIFPHMKRLVSFLRAQGVRYIAVDTDGNPVKLMPLLLEAGVDTLWPIERASDVSPQDLRKQFGRDLRLWGGVDKRVLAQGPLQIKAHLREFRGLIEEGGFIPTVDHLIPPDVSWDNFQYYWEYKRYLLNGEFGKLE